MRTTARPDSADVAASSGRLPDFLIIGAQKSGTSSLRSLLNWHPALHCIPEAHFFCGERGEHDLDWYRAKFADLPRHKLIGEKCPCYMRQQSALDRIAGAVPDVKLIAVLRDPVRRTQSEYWHWRSRGTETLELRQALAAEPARREAGRAFGYIDGSRYLTQLEEVCRRFPREQLCVLLFEELMEAPARALGPVCEFLGVEGFEADVEVPKVNAYREYHPQWLFHLMFRRHLFRFLPPAAARALRRAMNREGDYAPLDDDVERDLRAQFEPDNQRLAEWLGRDLDAWKTAAER